MTKISKKTTEPATDSAPNKAAWIGEIHQPDAVYNANVPVDLIERDPGNRVPSEVDIAVRAESIHEVGLLQPIVLRSLPDGKYRIVAGETRWLSFLKLGRATIPAMIRREESDTGAAMRRLVENMQRAELSPVERARQFRELAETHRIPQKEIGRLAGGVSQPVVANAIRMLALPEDVLQLIDSGKLSEAHGVNLVRWAKWPRVLRHMVDHLGPFGYTAKRLAEDPFPMAESMEDAGLVECIRVKKQAWNYGKQHPVYKIPDYMHDAEEFIPKGDFVYYILPDDPACNVWTQERLRQDEQRSKAEAAREKREVAARKAGKLTKEQIARRKAREECAARRKEIGAAMVVVLDKLRRTPAPSALLLAIVVEAAIAGGYSAQRIIAAAEAVGVKLPKGLADVQHGGQGMRDVEAMAGMDVMDLLRVAVAVLTQKLADDTVKYGASQGWNGGSGVPNTLERIMNAKVPVVAKSNPVTEQEADAGELFAAPAEECAGAGERILFTRQDAGGSKSIVVRTGTKAKPKRGNITQGMKELVRDAVIAGKTGAEGGAA